MIKKVLIRTLTGHSFLLSYDTKNDSFEGVMRQISQHFFPDFEPSDGTYSNHLTILLKNTRVTSNNFENNKHQLQELDRIPMTLTSGEIKAYLRKDKCALDALTDPQKIDQPEELIDKEQIADRLIGLASVYNVQGRDSQASGLRQNWSLLQGCLAFGGLVAGAAAWFSVASNVALLAAGNALAITSIVAMTIFAIASLVFGILGKKVCHSRNPKVSHANHLLNTNKRLQQREPGVTIAEAKN